MCNAMGQARSGMLCTQERRQCSALNDFDTHVGGLCGERKSVGTMVGWSAYDNEGSRTLANMVQGHDVVSGTVSVDGSVCLKL